LDKIRILWIANTLSVYTQNLISCLTYEDDNKIIEIDVFDADSSLKQLPEEILSLYGKVHKIEKHFPILLYKIKYIRFVFNLFDAYLSSFKLLKFRYNLVNIHYFTLFAFFLFPVYKKIGLKIMITPWGSDVYRIPYKFQKLLAKYAFKTADYISVHPIKFKKDIKDILYLSDSQIVDIEFGSKIIDTIQEIYNDQSKETIKDEWGLPEKYLIACGYNGNPAHNHLEIINAFKKIKTHITKDVCLVFPFTYGSNVEYYNKVKQELDSLKICYKIYDSFLSDVDMAKLRIITDMFIHVQTSDSYSASLQEYLLTDTKVINGSWLRYPDFEKSGMPYYLLDSFQELPELIIRILGGDNSVVINQQLKNVIIKNGWNSRVKGWYNFYLSQRS
jgi:hypothetical protein